MILSVLKKSVVPILLLLLIFPAIPSAQVTNIVHGTTRLSPKKLLLGKANCMVTPEVTYDTNFPTALTLVFFAEWKDQNNVRLTSDNHYLYLIDSFSGWVSNKGFEVVIDLSDKKLIDEHPDQIKETGKSIKPQYEKGFILIKDASTPLKLTIQPKERNEIILNLFFTYVYREAKKSGKIEKAAVNAVWKDLIVTRKPIVVVDCEAKARPYQQRIDQLILDYNRVDFLARLSSPAPDIAMLETGFNEFRTIVTSARALNDELYKDAGMNECSKTRSSLEASLKGAIPLDADFAAIEKQIADKKAPPAAVKETPKEEPKTVQKETAKPPEKPQRDIGAEIDALRLKYDGVYDRMFTDYAGIKADLTLRKAEIERHLATNGVRIRSVQEMFAMKERLSPESLEKMSANLDSCKTENQASDMAVNSLLEKIRDFKSQIDQEISLCKSEFQAIDKKTMPAKGKEVQDKLSALLALAGEQENMLEQLQQRIVGENKDILKLIMDLGGSVELSNLISQFESGFGSIQDRFNLLKSDFDALERSFEAKRFDNWYLKRVKNKFLAGVNKLQFRYDRLGMSYDSLIRAKRQSAEKVGFAPQIEAQRNFEKASTGFDIRLETLKSRILDSEYMPFPFGKVIIMAVLISILLFGSYVYLMALRRKKLKLATMTLRPSEKPSRNVIKLQQSEVKVSDKGKGLREHLAGNGDRYLELDMSHEWSDSAVKKVYFERDCIIKTYRFFEDSIHAVGSETTANETGGYLIGQWDFNPDDPSKYDVSLEDFIEPGDDATFSKYQLNFGAKIGVKLQALLENVRQKTNRDFVLTAWFHSHPGLKIFLSDYDLNVQKDFAGTDHKGRMIALVLDPYTPAWDMGIFTHKASGDMNNAADSIRFFSFDSIYHWAMKPTARPVIEENADQPVVVYENYYPADLSKNLPDASLKKVYFSSPLILEIKRFLEDARLASDPAERFAILYGQRLPGGGLILDQVARGEVAEKNLDMEDDRTVGALVSRPPFGRVLSEMLPERTRELQNMHAKEQLLLVFDPGFDTLAMVPAGSDSSRLSLDLKNAPRVILAEMIEWTRKRK